EDHRHPREDLPDQLAHPQRLHRFQQDDAQPGGGGHRRGARRAARRRLRFQLQRPLWPGPADARALHPARAGSRSGDAARCFRGQPRPAPGLGHPVQERETRRPRRALGGHRHHRHGGVGRRGEDRGQAAVPVAGRALRRRQAAAEGLRLRRRWLLLPRQGRHATEGRDAQVPRPRLLGREDEDRRRYAGRRPAPHRLGAVDPAGRPAPVRGRQRPLRPGHGNRLRQGPVAVRPVLVRGSGRPARLRVAGRAAQLLRQPDGDRREPVLDAGRAQPGPLRRHAPGPRLAAVRLRPQLWPGGVPAHAGHAQAARLVGRPLHPARRPPDVVGHRGRAGPGRQRVVPRPVPAIRRLPRWGAGARQPCRAARTAGHRLRRQIGAHPRDACTGRV
ncbi:MAG: mandelate racemase/muconate lactonizing enzyme family protein, partial [uncultured Ramlibacter sp.]